MVRGMRVWVVKMRGMGVGMRRNMRTCPGWIRRSTSGGIRSSPWWWGWRVRATVVVGGVICEWIVGRIELGVVHVRRESAVKRRRDSAWLLGLWGLLGWLALLLLLRLRLSW